MKTFERVPSLAYIFKVKGLHPYERKIIRLLRRYTSQWHLQASFWDYVTLTMFKEDLCRMGDLIMAFGDSFIWFHALF